ncbi:MAG: MarR family winged helix-turn-helix transcriptional regulator [Mycobacteriales bacterium]
MDREVVHFVRLAETVRLGAAEAVGSTLDRSAYLLLLTVADERGMTATRLAEALHLDISTITRQVAPLLSAGLLDRVAGPGKGAMLRVTPAGAREVRRVRKARQALMAELTADWTGAEREAFAGLLQRFNTAIRARRAR